MLSNLVKLVFGSHNDRYLKKLHKDVAIINDLEGQYASLSDAALRDKTFEFKRRISEGETLDNILHEAFALVREASKRTTGMRHFDVQLIGGIALHHGKIAEMKTGEGKTLVATLPVYLNALTGKGVHVVTVNDYLAKRDTESMGKIYGFLGLSTGVIIHGLSEEQRYEAYHSDVTYGTNHEFGFDYLRDNMKFYKNELVQREFNYAIVDEVDSILIDEARTPLIISGSAEDSSDLYISVSKLVNTLEPSDYEKDAKEKNITLTEQGLEKIENLLRGVSLLEAGNLYDFNNIHLVHYVNQSLKAWQLFEKEVDYVVKDGKVIIVDEFTGRMMDGRRYSDGLHQALEAKEGVEVQTESQTLASITYQNFFRLYSKLAGMTGTAITEETEFYQIYNLETAVIPTNEPVIRKDEDDEVYRTFKEKCTAIVAQVKECTARLQPVLVGTASIEKSELISAFLKKEGIKHNILNAKYHEYEAQIIAEAGMSRAVTIATNMAGRGTDIKLGGNAEMRIHELIKNNQYTKEKEEKIINDVKQDAEIVKKAGGLFILGTERHESRRIDNQLRGRSGRQGDPGQSKFFLSLEDDLMKIFGSERLDAMLQRFGLKEGEAIVHPWVNKSIAKAQARVEARNFEIRKHLLKYDDVLNNQRKVIYGQRKDLISEDYSVFEDINEFLTSVIEHLTETYFQDKDSLPSENLPNLHAYFKRVLDYDLAINENNVSPIEVKDSVTNYFANIISVKKQMFANDSECNAALKAIVLKVLDKNWKNHLLNLDHMRKGINLRAYAQKDPLNEYKIEAYNFFEKMILTIKEESLELIVKFKNNPLSDEFGLFGSSDFDKLSYNDDDGTDEQDAAEKMEAIRNKLLKLAKDTKCFCGSGKRFMDCHGMDM